MVNVNKKFKQWEKQFTRAEVQIEYSKRIARFKEHVNNNIDFGGDIVRWPLAVAPWPQSQVQYCVYDAIDARKWQLFRVSMKLDDTQGKLKMLLGYFVDECYGYAQTNMIRFEREKCRIDNYIGALRRGGQLNENMEISK